MEELYRSGIKPLSVEGYEDGQWVLVDCGDVVVHIFYEPVRAEYDIESLWMRAKRVAARDVA
jgi:ribosome-associated protein